MYIIRFSFLVAVALLQSINPSSGNVPNARVVDQISLQMQRHGKSGGVVEYRDCSIEDSHFDLADGPDIESFLRSVPLAVHLSWRTLPDEGTYLVEIGQTPINPLAGTMLPPTILDTGSLDRASEGLLSSKFVASKAAQLGIRFYDRNLGFSAIDRSSHNSRAELKLPAGSLAEDLNRIAAQKPGAVWVLTENSCGKRVTASFAWAFR
jgi:hypothetical protein